MPSQVTPRVQGSIVAIITPMHDDGQVDFDALTGLVEWPTVLMGKIVDSFGNTTRLQFSKVERNPKLDADSFRFAPPKGADVLTE